MLNGGFAHSERVGAAAKGRTVIAYLAAAYPRASQAEWTQRLAQGEIELDGVRLLEDQALCAGQRLVWHRPGWDEPEVPRSFSLVYEDESLVAVAKPSGLPTLPGGGFLEGTLLWLVRAQFPEASPMHRLGRGTSGLVLFARTAASGAAVQRGWRAGKVVKLYRALSEGVCGLDVLELRTPIGPVAHPTLGTVHAASATGKAAASTARVLERGPSQTLFEVLIDTGRPHQIRIHLACAGYPLKGDPLYGPGGLPHGLALPGDGGYWLHSHCLEFPHPITGATTRLVAEPPPELQTRAERGHRA